VLADLLAKNFNKLGVFIGFEAYDQVGNLDEVIHIGKDLQDVLQVVIHKLLETGVLHQLLGFFKLKA
jgi:hypothetical protein